MRVFEALGCAVFDEPFYPYWLKALQKSDDPGYQVTVDTHETDWRRIIDLVLGPIPDGRAWYYQKHMAIHMLDEVDLGWMREMQNCFLIRDPAAVIVSMTEFRQLAPRSEADVIEAANLVGIPQLKRIFDRACELGDGQPPPVVDADDVLIDPKRVLAGFCAAIGMPFDPDRPIEWTPGRHPYDGAWADDWYEKVYQTTGLEPFTPKAVAVPPELEPIVAYCRPAYEAIAQYRIR